MDASSSRLEVCKELLIQNAAILSIDRKKYMISRDRNLRNFATQFLFRGKKFKETRNYCRHVLLAKVISGCGGLVN